MTDYKESQEIDMYVSQGHGRVALWGQIEEGQVSSLQRQHEGEGQLTGVGENGRGKDRMACCDLESLSSLVEGSSGRLDIESGLYTCEGQRILKVVKDDPCPSFIQSKIIRAYFLVLHVKTFHKSRFFLQSQFSTFPSVSSGIFLLLCATLGHTSAVKLNIYQNFPCSAPPSTPLRHLHSYRSTSSLHPIPTMLLCHSIASTPAAVQDALELKMNVESNAYPASLCFSR